MQYAIFLTATKDILHYISYFDHLHYGGEQMNGSAVLMLLCVLLLGVAFWQHSPASSDDLEN